MDAALDALLALLALPKVGLGALFVIAFVSATLLPLGSEPALYGLVHLDPGLAWPALLIATLGNTLGGALTWWMGHAAQQAVSSRDALAARRWTPHPRALRWLERWGPPACVLAWLPVVGDPLCAVAGWLRLPFGACVVYMAVGKFLRYGFVAGAALAFWPAT